MREACNICLDSVTDTRSKMSLIVEVSVTEMTREMLLMVELKPVGPRKTWDVKPARSP